MKKTEFRRPEYENIKINEKPNFGDFVGIVSNDPHSRAFLDGSELKQAHFLVFLIFSKLSLVFIEF